MRSNEFSSTRYSVDFVLLPWHWGSVRQLPSCLPASNSHYTKLGTVSWRPRRNVSRLPVEEIVVFVALVWVALIAPDYDVLFCSLKSISNDVMSFPVLRTTRDVHHSQSSLRTHNRSLRYLLRVTPPQNVFIELQYSYFQYYHNNQSFYNYWIQQIWNKDFFKGEVMVSFEFSTILEHTIFH